MESRLQPVGLHEICVVNLLLDLIDQLAFADQVDAINYITLPKDDAILHMFPLLKHIEELLQLDCGQMADHWEILQEVYLLLYLTLLEASHDNQELTPSQCSQT